MIIEVFLNNYSGMNTVLFEIGSCSSDTVLICKILFVRNRLLLEKQNGQKQSDSDMDFTDSYK